MVRWDSDWVEVEHGFVQRTYAYLSILKQHHVKPDASLLAPGCTTGRRSVKSHESTPHVWNKASRSKISMGSTPTRKPPLEHL